MSRVCAHTCVRGCWIRAPAMGVAAGPWSQGGLSSGIGGWAPGGTWSPRQGRRASLAGAGTGTGAPAGLCLLLNSDLPGVGPGVPTLSRTGRRTLCSRPPPSTQPVPLRLSAAAVGPREPPSLLGCHTRLRPHACLQGQERACGLHPLLLVQTHLCVDRPWASGSPRGRWG